MALRRKPPKPIDPGRMAKLTDPDLALALETALASATHSMDELPGSGAKRGFVLQTLVVSLTTALTAAEEVQRRSQML